MCFWITQYTFKCIAALLTELLLHTAGPIRFVSIVFDFKDF